VSSGPRYVDVDCALEALPKISGVSGFVRDEDGAPVASALVTLASEIAPKTATTDASGAFAFADLKPGTVTLRAEAEGFMVHVQSQDLHVGEEAKITMSLNRKPKNSQVKIEGKEIKLANQIHFENDSAKILGDSNVLLEEIAEVLRTRPNLRSVEIQGHTDNVGQKEHNVTLSDNRANEVRKWLVNAGIDSARLSAKGYGPDKPLAPNVSAGNRAKNRRVQFIILDK
jgi:outer membrane protein OmpA-like peptidoglycan-associated protein